MINETHLPIAVRAYATCPQGKQWSGQKGTKSKISYSDYKLIFDTETTTDTTQRLRFGFFQVRKGEKLKKSGLFYDPAVLSDQEIELVNSYAIRNGLLVMTRDEFIDSIFFHYVYDLSGLCIGLNLPFDLSRIAIDQSTTKSKSMRGGFTFLLTQNKYRPRVMVKHLNNRAALIQFTIPGKQLTSNSKRRRGEITPYHRGYFVDVRTLAGALLSGSWSLDALSKHLNIEHKKQEADRHGEFLTEQYLEYAFYDVQATWECFRALSSRYDDYGLVQTPVTKIYSEASIGKAYLKQMNIKQWKNLQPDFPKEQLGAIMSAYYGGRSEARTRRQICRVLYCDFRSMYPTTCVLMKLWKFVVAQGIEWKDDTTHTQALLDNISLDDLQKPEMWQHLSTLVKVQPNDDVFPVRAKYDGHQYCIGLNYITAQKPLWYTLADCIASKILTGRAPKVIEAIQFSSLAIQDDLRPINIAGNPDYHIDPVNDDFYKRLIELRTKVKAKIKACSSDMERNKFDTEQNALKICANATSYGIFVELNVTEQNKLTKVECYGSSGKPFANMLKNIEEPGKYFHPLLATLLTGASRLMLAIAEKLADNAGLSWAYCDTDSLSIVRTEDITEPDFLTRTRNVVDWFVPLNPYEQLPDKGKASLLEIEKQNYSINNSDIEPLYCFAISAKRNILFNIDSNGQPIIRKASAHGLGHLLPPYGEKDAPKSIPAPVISLRNVGVERWHYDLWYRIVLADLEGHPMQVMLDDLPGFDKPAVSRYAASTPALLKWFKKENKNKPYEEQIKPFNFMLAFHPKKSMLSEERKIVQADELKCRKRKKRQTVELRNIRAVASYNTDPALAVQHCFDRNTNQQVKPEYLQSYRETLSQYHLHPEAKFDHADYMDCGLTARKHVVATSAEHIGKEANRLEEQWYLGIDNDAQIIYGVSPEELEAQWHSLMDGFQNYTLRQIAKASELDIALVSRLVAGKVRPSKQALLKMQAGIVSLNRDKEKRANNEQTLINAVEEQCQHISARQFAKLAEIDHCNLCRILTGKRKLSAVMLSKIETFLLNLNKCPDSV